MQTSTEVRRQQDGQPSLARADNNLDRQIPTLLSYVDGDEYYGQQAKHFLVRNPKNTIAYFRDFIGKEYGLMPALAHAPHR